MSRPVAFVAFVTVVVFAATLMGVSVSPAVAAVTVTRAELSGSRLRLEGTAVANRTITVDGVAMGISDGAGNYRIERDPYGPPADCTVDLRDGSAVVTVVGLVGCSITSTGDTTAPTTPANLTATLSGSTVDLAWSPSTDGTGVTGYRVTRNGVVIIQVLNTFYNDTNMAAGSYTYSVVAVDAAGNVSGSSTSATVAVSPPPATDSTAPTVPTGLVTTVVGSTVSLGWTQSTDGTGVTGYRVTRNGIVRGTTNDTTFLESGLAAGTHTYSVAAFDGAGNVSAESATTSATVAAAEALAFITPTVLPDATLGQSYLGYIVASDPPGPSTFRFKVISGKVPPGTRFVENTLPTRPEARVTGVPTARGTFSFTVEVSDGTGAVARRTFSLTVR